MRLSAESIQIIKICNFLILSLLKAKAFALVENNFCCFHPNSSKCWKRNQDYCDNVYKPTHPHPFCFTGNGGKFSMALPCSNHSLEQLCISKTLKPCHCLVIWLACIFCRVLLLLFGLFVLFVGVLFWGFLFGFEFLVWFWLAGWVFLSQGSRNTTRPVTISLSMSMCFYAKAHTQCCNIQVAPLINWCFLLCQITF